MNGTRIALAALAAAAITVLPTVDANAADPAWTKNCTALNKEYRHGVGKRNARDHTSGTPVTNFKRSNKLYSVADKANGGLDRDNDGIACEKA